MNYNPACVGKKAKRYFLKVYHDPPLSTIILNSWFAILWFYYASLSWSIIQLISTLSYGIIKELKILHPIKISPYCDVGYTVEDRRSGLQEICSI